MRRIALLEESVTAEGAAVRRGGDWDRWDLEISGGTLGGVRLRAAVEDHGAGRQLARFRCWPVVSSWVLLSPVLAMLALGAAWDGAGAAAWTLGALAAVVIGRAAWECAVAMGVIDRRVRRAQAVEAAQQASRSSPRVMTEAARDDAQASDDRAGEVPLEPRGRATTTPGPAGG